MNAQDIKDMQASMAKDKGVCVGPHDIDSKLRGHWAGRNTVSPPTQGELDNLQSFIENASRIYECKFELSPQHFTTHQQDISDARYYVVRTAADGQRITGSVFAGCHTVRELQCLLYAFCRASEFARWIDSTNQERIDGGFDPAPPPTEVKYCLPVDPGYFIPPTVAGYYD